MGRIEKALGRAKRSNQKLGDGGAALDASSSTAIFHPSTQPLAANRPPSVFDDLWEQASPYFLDPDILRANRIVTDEQPLAIKSAYKMLRTRLLQRMRSNRWNKLAVSSARTGAGKTLTAINTAISLAREPNQRVILVDLDLRRPSIARYLGLEPRHDLSDYLLDFVPIEDVIIKTSIERLLIIPSVTVQEYSSELLSGPRMADLVKRLTVGADDCIIIFDFPPMLDADDMLAFSPHIDALLLVVAECETRRADLQQVGTLVEEMAVIGVVLNKSDDTSPAYY